MDTLETKTPIRLFIFHNPVAGRGDLFHPRRRIEAYCERRGWAYEIYETGEDEDLVPIVQQAVRSGFSAVAAAGGDGTVSAVAGGLVFAETPLLILPTGTGNLLSRDLGVPQDLNRALELAGGGSAVQLLDTMEIAGRHYVMNAGVGLSSQIIQNTDRRQKRRLGVLAYVKSGGQALLGLQPYGFRLVVDGRALRMRASEVLVCCGGLLGVRVPFEDLHVLPDDGKVDLFIVKARSLPGYAELLYYILRRKPRSAPKMVYMQAAERIEIACDSVLPAEADGEVIGATPLAINIVPRAVRVLVPDERPPDLAGRLRALVGRSG